MSKKTHVLPSLSYSLKQTTPAKQARTPAKRPVMLHIKGVPDSNSILVQHFDPELGAFVYAYNGNLSMLADEHLEGLEHHPLVLGGASPKRAEIPRVDFAFNYISDPDLSSKALEAAIEFVDSNGIPCLNHPAKVKQTSRDRLYQNLGHMDGIVIPKTLRVAPHYSSDIQEIIERGDISLPIIVRPAGGHDGLDMLLLKSLDDIPKLECFALDGRDYYLIEFHDYRSNDALNRKYRCYRKNLMQHDKTLQQEDVAFLEDPETVLGTGRWNLLSKFCKSTGLDYCGIDFAVKQTGEILVFEANPAMNTSKTKSDNAAYIGKYWLEHEKVKIQMLKEMAKRVQGAGDSVGNNIQ
ncbi:hypothetical protein [Solemya velum gill symbiont]|uniref:hypothetical protein n=1 Tax=Solemya velum gill symbiont TaxID=2340 RepID=UPI00117B0314|nr:hypothetical protein [Solemya velum gill symbiont]